MRILLASFVDDKHTSGMGKWSHRMAEALTRLGHEPTLWFAGDFPRVRRTGRLAVLLFPAALALRILRERARFDAVVIHEPSGLCYALLRRFWRGLPPLVLMCHNVESKVYGEMLRAARRGYASVSRGARIKAPLFRLWQSDGAIRLADVVVCLSSVDRDYAVRLRRRASATVVLKLNGAGEEFFRVSVKNQVGRRVLFVGGWLDIKGRRMLPALWSRVRAEFPDARLTIAGSGQDAGRVLADFGRGERESVTVVARVADEAEMAELYASHDVLLMPSLSEGSPLALLEAMAAGVVVVAARTGGIPNIVTHDRDGLLFETMDIADAAAQVCRVLAESDDAARLGRAGRERALRLSWDSSARTLSDAVEAAARVGVERARDEKQDEVYAGRVVNE